MFGITTLLIAVLSIPASFLVTGAIWSVWFGDLSKIPGPKVAAATRLVLIWHKAKGDAERWRLDLHRAYGDVVRVAPNEVSFASGAAWQEIYGHAAGSRLARCRKDPTFYSNHTLDVDLVVANDEHHVRQRKCFSHAFSDQALSKQEPLIQQYVSHLVSNIAQSTDSFDIVRQYNFATFDIMADLTFGEPLGCLAKSEYISWVSTIFAAVQAVTIITEINQYPLLRRGLSAMIPRSIQEKTKQHRQFAADRVDKRLSQNLPRSDVWNFVLASADKGNQLTRSEMHANAAIFMLAGSETTATLLSGLTFYLLVNPDKMRRLTQEIRSTFSSAEQICASNLTHLRYLNACIQEALRMYPPVPIGLPRVVPKGGTEICNYRIPESTCVYVHQLSTYHNPKNFTRPNEFLPQRWISDDPDHSFQREKTTASDVSEFATDNRSCVQPFLVGPRSCIGSNLAWLEIRLLAAHVFWRFDLELVPDDGAGSWDQQRIFSLWDKKPLVVKAVSVTRSVA